MWCCASVQRRAVRFPCLWILFGRHFVVFLREGSVRNIPAYTPQHAQRKGYADTVCIHALREIRSDDPSSEERIRLRPHVPCDRQCQYNTDLCYFFIIKPIRCTNSTNLFWHESLHVSDSSSAHHQEFIHCKSSSSSSLARQPLMGPGLLKKLCLFASVEGDRSGFNFFRFRNNIF